MMRYICFLLLPLVLITSDHKDDPKQEEAGKVIFIYRIVEGEAITL